MRIDYLGDSYDFVKRSLLQCLNKLGPWLIVPMFTEEIEARDANHLQLFLGAPIISTSILSNENRSLYFKSAVTDEHLFVDPNTGLRLTKGGKNPLNYLFGSELVLLAEQRPRRLTMVFDQSLGRAVDSARRDEVAGKLRELQKENLFGFAYYSHACFLLLSRDETVLREAKERLAEGLGLPRWRLVEP